MTPSERFKNFLATQNLRMTEERRLVVEEVFSRSGHFTISDLLKRLQKKKKLAARATIYRIIPLLLKAGMIFEVSVRGGREEQVYENTYGQRHHDHLTCEYCNAVVEFESDKIHDLEEKVAERYGYRLRRHVHHLRGICPECQKKIISREVNAW